jgi:hypothetical protein
MYMKVALEPADYAATATKWDRPCLHRIDETWATSLGGALESFEPRY